MCVFMGELEPCRQIGWLPVARHRCLVVLNSVLYGSVALPVSHWEHWHASRHKWPLSFFLPSTIILTVSPSQPYSFHPCTYTSSEKWEKFHRAAWKVRLSQGNQLLTWSFLVVLLWAFITHYCKSNNSLSSQQFSNMCFSVFSPLQDSIYLSSEKITLEENSGTDWMQP